LLERRCLYGELPQGTELDELQLQERFGIYGEPEQPTGVPDLEDLQAGAVRRGDGVAELGWIAEPDTFQDEGGKLVEHAGWHGDREKP